MAMTVLNNTSAMMTLGELNKNISRVGKDLSKISKGERLTNFGAGSSDVAISEKMRELVRSLGQNERNVQTGANLMKVAEGAVQEQLELLKTVKEKVINASNDSNTDADRAIIQKEIDQCFAQMEDIAQTTNYNGKRLLTGDSTDTVRAMVETVVVRPVLYHNQPIWVELDEPQFIEESQIGYNPNGNTTGIIPDRIPMLDGIEGPFEVFKQEAPTTPIALNTFGIEASYTANAFSGGKDGAPKTLTIDFSSAGYSNVSDLDGKGFTLGGISYVFTTDMNKHYTTDKLPEPGEEGIPIECNKIDISSCLTWGDVASTMANAMSGNYAYTSSVNSGKIVFSTRNLSQSLDAINSTPGLGSLSNSGDSVGKATIITSPAEDEYYEYIQQTGVETVSKTGAIAGIEYFEGGKNPVSGKEVTTVDPVTDKTKTIKIGPDIPGEQAKAIVDISSAEEGSGIKLHGYSDVYIFFKDGSESPSTIPSVDANGNVSTTDPAIYFVGKDYNGGISIPNKSGMKVNLSSGTLTATAIDAGTTPNHYWYIDNIPVGSVSYTFYDGSNLADTSKVIYIPPKVPTTVDIEYEQMQPLNLSGVTENLSEQGATYATYNLDYINNLGSVEDFISEMSYKTMTIADENNPSYSLMSYTFYDSGVLGNNVGTFYTGAGGNRWIDLNEIRESVNKGETLGDAITSLLKRNIPYDETNYPNGLVFRAHNIGTPGNNERIHASAPGTSRHYTIDFRQAVKNGVVGNIPSSLIGRGLRIYCATDDHEWWNFQFTDSKDPKFEDERPESEKEHNHIRSIRIDISECTNANDVAQAFYEQANPYLNGKKTYHNLQIAANTNTGEVTFYDERVDDLTFLNGYETLMGKGGGLDENYGWWKIADGIYDNVYQSTGDKWIDTEFLEEVPTKVPVRDFAIQDNPHANRTLWLKLPITTLDKVLGYDKSENVPEDFNVMTKEMRDKLLGERLNEQGEDGEVTGILDKGIVYLTNANTLIGSQIQRLNMSEANIVTKAENTQAAESTIRDADLAKEMTSFTKNNILMQASQAMLSQANQNASGVISLLQ